MRLSPSLREGSDDSKAAKAYTTMISIHAPAKGATCVTGLTPAPVAFQSTLPRRERRNRNPELRCQRQISIHAPAKGATLVGVDLVERLEISIHAPVKGATGYIARQIGLN